MEKSRKNKVYAIIAGAMMSLSAMLMMNPYFCDALSNATEQAAKGIQLSAQGIIKWLIVLVLVVTGIILIIGTRRQKDEVRENAPSKLIGVALVICAVSLAGMITGWFTGN